MGVNKFKFVIFSFFFSIIFTIVFWQTLNLTDRLTPFASGHETNLEKYNEKYKEMSVEKLMTDVSLTSNYLKSKVDIGYSVLVFISKAIGLNFESFLFIVIIINYMAYILTFSKITSSKNWIIYIGLMILASFWMNSSIAAVLRQGVAICFLFFFLFRKESISFSRGLTIVLIASAIHISAIIFVPYIILEKRLIQKLKLLNLIYLFISIIYIFNINFFISDLLMNFLNFFDIHPRSLQYYRINHPTTGFSLTKFLVTTIPIILFSLALKQKKKIPTIFEKRIYLYYIYPSIIGMMLSQISYHDRIFLFAWTFSPIFIAYFLISIYKIFYKSLIKNDSY